MGRDFTPEVLQAVAFAKAAYAVPEIHAGVDFFVMLTGTSAAFWIVSKTLGWLALTLHEVLDRALADLFAVSYNIGLAVFYASVMASSVAQGAGARFLWKKAAGFVLVYVTLRSLYSDRQGKVDEYGLLGFIGGAAAYITFMVRPLYLARPMFTQLFDVVSLVMQSGVGRVFTALAVIRALFLFARRVARAIIAVFQADA